MKRISITLAKPLEQEAHSGRASLNVVVAMHDITRITALALGLTTELSWFQEVVLRKESQEVPFQNLLVQKLKQAGGRLTVSAHHTDDGVAVHVEALTDGGSVGRINCFYTDGKRDINRTFASFC